jgi:uncharacterized SAM-binding protein YcdF (DUF218 family)
MRRRNLVRPGGRAERRLCIAGVVLVAVLLALGVSFLRFVQQASRTADPPPHADGIVVLTGGADRIEAALRLLENGAADRLLVSGIGGGADLKDLARSAGADSVPFAGRVTLGRGAATTHDNAAETASWAQQAGVHSLIVVTAAYHMPRALTEIGRALPGVQLYPAPVLPPGILRADDWPTAAGLRLLAEEWTKLLAAKFGLTALEPASAPVLSAASRSSHPKG